MGPYVIEFYQAPAGDYPVEKWLDGLTPTKRRAAIAAIEEILKRDGVNVCGTLWGDNIGDGVFEFRNRHSEGQIRAMVGDKAGEPNIARREKILLRIFCHAYGNRVVLLLGAYDKAKRDKGPYQQKQIAIAKKRVADFKRRHGV